MQKKNIRRLEFFWSVIIYEKSLSIVFVGKNGEKDRKRGEGESVCVREQREREKMYRERDRILERDEYKLREEGMGNI